MMKYIFDAYEFKFEFDLNRTNKTEKLHFEAHLLHMPKHILPAVKHTLAFLCIQVKDKICGVVGIAFLISVTKVAN